MRWIRRTPRHESMPTTKRTASSGERSPLNAEKMTSGSPSSGEKRMLPEADWPVPGGKEHPMFGPIYCTCVFSTMLFLYFYFSNFAHYYSLMMGRS